MSETTLYIQNVPGFGNAWMLLLNIKKPPAGAKRYDVEEADLDTALENADRLVCMYQGKTAEEVGDLPDSLVDVNVDEIQNTLQGGDLNDLTPRITYKDGVATKITTFCNWNNAYRMSSEYTLTPNGEITEWHEDPEHGNWPEPRVMSKERLGDLRGANPGSMHEDDILGKSRKDVESYLSGKGLNAIHENA